MGYTTQFEGRFDLDRTLEKHHAAYLTQFAEIRHMGRNPAQMATMPDPLRIAVDLPLGSESEYYTGGDTIRIPDMNKPPTTCPGLWLNWIPTEDGNGIEWNEAEKFYEYSKWLEFLIDNFLTRWGYRVSGTVIYQGEEPDDNGTLTVEENKVIKYPTHTRSQGDNE